jgi:phage anti-repressor protein
MSTLTFSFKLAQQLNGCTESFPVNLDDAWVWLGYAKKQNAKDTLYEYFEEGVDFIRSGVKSNTGGRPGTLIFMSVECLKQMGMICKTPQGKQIRNYFLECEKIAKSLTQPQLPQTYLEALKSLVKAEEEKQLLQAMNEQLEQENHLLAEMVDEVFGYSSIVRVAIFNGCSEKLFNWRKLKAASAMKDLEIKSVPCPRFGTKNLYSHDAWRYVYPEVSLPEITTLAIRPR